MYSIRPISLLVQVISYATMAISELGKADVTCAATVRFDPE